MSKNRNYQRFNQQTTAKAADVFEDDVTENQQGDDPEVTQEYLTTHQTEDPTDDTTAEDSEEETESGLDEDASDEGDVEEDDDSLPGVDEESIGDGADSLDEDEEPSDEIVGSDTPLTYPFTDVTDWTKEELEAYISRPDGMDIYHSKLVQAIEIHRRLSTELDRAWDVDECTYYFKHGVTPEKTQFGNYFNDVTRKLRRESEWTTAELESWAMGLIRPEGLVTTSGLAVELHNRFKMPIQSVDPEMVIAHYKYNFGPNKGNSVVKVGEVPTVTAAAVAPEVKAEVEKKIKYAGLNDMNQSYIEETLKNYIETVKPNKVVPEKVGFEAQRELNRVLQYILKLEDPAGVKSGLDILVSTIVAERIHNPKGVFSDTNIFRFAEGIALENKQQETHRRLFTLFFAFIDGDEGILAQTDVPELIKYLPARQQNLLLGYLRRS